MKICNVSQNNHNTAWQMRNKPRFFPCFGTTCRFSSLPKDTVVIDKVKKSQFEGIDFAVVEKFKPPIEKFKTKDDLQTWAAKEAEKISNTDFGGRKKETKIQRKTMIKEWSDYVLKENNAYNKATALLILNAITKGLKPDNDKLPPVLNKGVLADCISEIDKNAKADKKYQFDLVRMYETKLNSSYLEDTNTGETGSKWVVIPSKTNDPENFEANVEKLKTLSHKNWCTKSFNAEPYLSEGDFHVYLENGKPKLGVRFVNDEIEEIQGEQNNNKIPLSYYDELKKHIQEKNLKLHFNSKREFEDVEKLKKEVELIKEDLKNAIENNDAKEIFKYFGFLKEEDSEGFLTLSKYKQPSQKYTFRNLGIDENKLFEKIKRIEGDVDFKNLQVKNLRNLKSIGGYANFENSSVTDLGNLTSIGGYAYFGSSQITNLGNLTSIGGYANFGDSQVTDLGKLASIGDDAEFGNSQITDLGNLSSIGGDAAFGKSQIQNLGNLKSIGKNAYFKGSKVTNLGNLESIGRDADFALSQITNLGNLKLIGNDADFRFSKITDLGKLELIGGTTYYDENCLLSEEDKIRLAKISKKVLSR